MKIEVDHRSKTTTVWLTQAEREDPAIKTHLDKLYADCKTSKYMVAVFHSGSQELCQETGALLRHNLRRSAQGCCRQNISKSAGMDC